MEMILPRANCSCGDAIKEARQHDSIDCSSECPGDISLKCGGYWQTSVYQTSISDNDVKDSNKVGCFKLTYDVHPALWLKFAKTNSPRRCVNACRATGYPYAGLRAKIFCNCYDKKTKDLSEEESKCNLPCPGDSSFNCGGSDEILAYSTAGELESPQPSSSCSKSHTLVNGEQACKGQLIFSEDFNGESIDINKWSQSVFMPLAPDYEFVIFNNSLSNTYVQGGKLYINPSVEENDEFVRTGSILLNKCTGIPDGLECFRTSATFNILPPVSSARLSTKNSFSFKYGNVQIRAKLPEGDWILPELWLEPKWRSYGTYYQSGRVRLAMARGNEDLRSEGHQLGSSFLESGVLMGNENELKKTQINKRKEGGWNKDFHNFTILWTPDNFFLSIDGGKQEPLLTSSYGKVCQAVGFSGDGCLPWAKGSLLAPFDKEFYISVGLSVGGMRDFPDNSQSGDYPKPWRNWGVKAMVQFWKDKGNWLPTWKGERSALQIDSIKVFAL